MGACCTTMGGKFDAEYVAREVQARRKKGPGRTARLLAAAVEFARSRGGPDGASMVDGSGLDGFGLAGASALDVGAGLGDVLAALFKRGLGEATHVEASRAYSEAARDLAGEEGYEDRVRFEVGDFLDLVDLEGGAGEVPDGTSRVPKADIVALDRVICCYPDMPVLLDASASRARDVYALSAPRSRWPVRLFVGFENLTRRIKNDPFRTFVHSWPEMDRRLEGRGFERVWDGGTPIWRIGVYRRVRPSHVL